MTDPVLLQLVLFALAASSSSEVEKPDLAAEIKNGDHAAFRSFFEAHHQSLFRFLLSKNIDPATAEDLIQQAFVYIWDNRSSIDPAKSLRAYLFKIAYTRMLNHIRDHKKFDPSATVASRETNHTPEDTVRASDLREAIRNAINEMPEKRGLVFEFCFMQEFTYKEAAKTLDVSVKTIENHMALALKDIRVALKRFKKV